MAERSAALATFYAGHAAVLERAVARRVSAPAVTIADACQTAWAILVPRPDVTLDACGLSWLTTVATREAWRLASTTRELPAGTLANGASALELGELAEPASA